MLPVGGTPPLGYAPDRRSLKIVDAHDAIVRDIFERYLQLGDVRQVAEQLERDNILALPCRTSMGRHFGGMPLSCSSA